MRKARLEVPCRGDCRSARGIGPFGDYAARVISPLVERALQVALVAHSGQSRKGDPEKPYAVHPLHVALLLAGQGAGEAVIVTALLHDVVEDCEGWDCGRLSDEFGPEVAAAVDELTEDKSLSWSERKRAGVRKVSELSETALWVKTCDKLHNLTSLVAQLRAAEDPEQVWAKFSGGPERTLRNSRAMVDALRGRLSHPLTEALDAAMRELELAAG